MPRSFSETGAVGAGSGAGASPGTGGYAPISATVNDTGMMLPRADTAPEASTGAPAGGGNLLFQARPAGQVNPTARPPNGLHQDTAGDTGWGMQFKQGTGWSQGFTSDWANGGAIPMEGEEPDFAMGPGNGLAAAMASAKEVLAYGRKKHGLGAGDDEGAVGDQAGLTRMPTVPGNQSESGVKPLQPDPGKLPPTNNPFGKRAEAEPEEGAIDTEEDMA